MLKVFEMGDIEQHPNVKLLMKGLQAFNENDLDAQNEFIHKDVIYRVSGRGPLAGAHKGRQAYRQAVEKAKKLSGGTISLKPLVILADDEYVFMLARATGKRGQKILDIEHCYLYRFREGQLVEGRTMPIDLYEFDEFWS